MPAGIAAPRPAAVAMSASEMPGATTARLADPSVSVHIERILVAVADVIDLGSDEIPDVFVERGNVEPDIVAHLLLQSQFVGDSALRFQSRIAHLECLCGIDVVGGIEVEDLERRDLEKMAVRQMKHAAVGDGERQSDARTDLIFG